MAEKEERILVLNATEDDFIYKHFNGKGFIPRQEAIERIAKAICAGDCENCSDGPMGGPDCIRWLEDCGRIAKAEAALNALLEGK